MEYGNKYKYNLLIGELQKKITAGEFVEGEKLPPERNLAKEYGVSRVTIRTALNQLSNEGMLEIRPNVGAFVKLPKMVIPEKNSRHYRFCVILNPDPMGIDPLLNPFNNRVILGMLRAKSPVDDFELEYFVMPKSAVSFQDEFEKQNFDMHKVDGILIIAGRTQEDVEYLSKQNIPFVVSGEMGGPEFVPTVTTDNYRGTYKIVEHLIGQGCRRPWYLFYQNDYIWDRRRRAGFIRALEDAGISWDEHQFVKGRPTTAMETQEVMWKIMAAPHDFDSLFIPSDMQLVGVIEVLKRSGLNVPKDIQVVMMDYYPWSSSLIPPLPMLVQPFAEYGEKMVRLLISHIQNPDNGVMTIVVQPKLILPSVVKADK